MDATALHLELRNALSLADELSRHEHALGHDGLAAQLAVVRTAIRSREEEVGKTHRGLRSASPLFVNRLERSLEVIREHSEQIPLVLRPRFVALMDSLERLVFAEQRPLAPVPAKPLFGMFPIARVIPQDVHSVGDYLIAATYLTSAMIARTRRGRAIGLMLGLGVGGVSLATDYRLSLMKAIPIEAHELLDHVSGLKAATSPLLFDYVRKDPIAAAMQIACGLGTIALSLFTDYRADRGVGRALRSKGGPTPVRDRLPKNVRNRVPEVQRPLEGLSAPSDLYHVDM